MAEEVNNTENTENGNAQQDAETGAANTEPEKKYSEEEMNGISKKNSEKAVAKVLRELGITDKVKAKEILSKAAAEEAANSENNGTGEEMSQIQQALAKERERADGLKCLLDTSEIFYVVIFCRFLPYNTPRQSKLSRGVVVILQFYSHNLPQICQTDSFS